MPRPQATTSRLQSRLVGRDKLLARPVRGVARGKGYAQPIEVLYLPFHLNLKMLAGTNPFLSPSLLMSRSPLGRKARPSGL